MRNSLDGSLAVVFGGAAGVGAGMATEAARRGARVVIGDNRDASTTIEAIAADGGTASAVGVDVTDLGSVDALFRRVRDEFGEINVVVNNPGEADAVGRLWETDACAAQRDFNVAILGGFHIARAAAPYLLEAAEAGHAAYLLTVSSEHSLGIPTHLPTASSRTVSSYALLGIHDAARSDFEGSGVGASLVTPSFVLSGDISESTVSSHGQTPAEIATIAFDGLVAGAYIIPTNAVSRGFAMDHAREVMRAIQMLPLDGGLKDLHVQDGSGDMSMCPVAPGLLQMSSRGSALV